MAEGVETVCCAAIPILRGSPRLRPRCLNVFVALTLTTVPGETMRWTADMMAAASGISASAVPTSGKPVGWHTSCFRPFKEANDLKFTDKLNHLVGLYVSPPADAIVLPSQIQALAAHGPDCRSRKGGSAR